LRKGNLPEASTQAFKHPSLLELSTQASKHLSPLEAQKARATTDQRMPTQWEQPDQWPETLVQLEKPDISVKLSANVSTTDAFNVIHL
jgi:hypothetical protein